MAVRLAPPEKLLVVKLEDGLGWDQICLFLGEKIPDEAYPAGNDPDEFGKMIMGWMMGHWAWTLAPYAAGLAVLVATGGWWWRRGRRG
jgi:hypothetical protein